MSGQAHKPGDIPFPQALPGPANGVVVTGPTLRPAVSPGTRSPSSLQQRTDSYDITGRRDRRTLGSGGPVYTWGYDAKDRITSYGDPAGVRRGLIEQRSYDRAGRLTRSGTTRGPGSTAPTGVHDPVSAFDLDLDPVGNPTRVVTTRGGVPNRSPTPTTRSIA